MEHYDLTTFVTEWATFRENPATHCDARRVGGRQFEGFEGFEGF